MGTRGNGVHAPPVVQGVARGVRRRRMRAALAGTVLLAVALVGCSTGSGSPTETDPSNSARATEGSNDGDGDGDMHEGMDSEPYEIGFDELIDDSAQFVDRRVRVIGNVFFISECPPPGAATATCVLLGYLADPEQRTLIAADVEKAIALAEGGRRLSCPEGSQPTPTCGDWVGDATYTVEGVVQRQVLGGRETALVQLDVSEKSAPQPW